MPSTSRMAPLYLFLLLLPALLLGPAAAVDQTPRHPPDLQLLDDDHSHPNHSEDAHDGNHSDHHEGGCHHGPPERYPVSHVDLCHVRVPLTVAFWLILTCIAEILFHQSKRFSETFPDSALLIILGILVGLLLSFTNWPKSAYSLDSGIFFLYLLPPVVFEAGYFMPARAFFDNLGTILCYAVIGTLFNTTCIGLALWGVSFTGIFTFAPAGGPLPILSALLFSSLISAVDPVAVLCVFEEIHVNEILFIVIFGESLLNDAVSVVLYKVMLTFSSMESIIAIDYLAGILSFFVVALGGVGIGIVCGMAACIITRWTKHVRVLEPLIVFMVAYTSYLLAELFHLSGILAIAFCGMTMREYMQTNISHKSTVTVKYFLKMLSRSCEGIMFMFLGLSAVTANHRWNAPFIVLTVVFCLVFRAIGVVLQTAVVNLFRVKKLTWLDQFIMSYSGLRGAIAYGLVEAVDKSVVGADVKFAFVTATVIVILFTVFVQGTTIKPVVNCMKVAKDEEEHKSMHHTIIADSIDHLMSGIESLAGVHGHNWWRDKFNYVNSKILNRVLMTVPPSTTDSNIIQAYTKLSYAHALNAVKMATHSPSGSKLDMASLNESQGFGLSNLGARFRHHVHPKPDYKGSKVTFATDTNGTSEKEKNGTEKKAGKVAVIDVEPPHSPVAFTLADKPLHPTDDQADKQ